MTDEFDIHRSEGEGMVLGDRQHLDSIYEFIGKVKNRFDEDHTIKHLEDAAANLIDGMDESDKKKYLEIKQNLPSLIESYFGPKVWESFQEAERDRIFEFDLLSSEGVG